MFRKRKELTGSRKLKDPIMIIGLVVIAVIASYIISKGGIRTAFFVGAIPIGLLFLNRVFTKPDIGLYTTVIASFFVIGITRYIPGIPLGLAIDGLLVLTFIAVFFKNFYTGLSREAFTRDLTILVFVWFLYSVAELFNPLAVSKTAWFYAMRGMSLYSLLSVPLVFLIFNKVKHLNTFLYIWGAISILGTLKGMMQLYIGPDFAEQRWLAEGGAVTHILFGQLRVFSFYSDAGQFGAAQGAAGVMGIIVALNTKNLFKKAFFLIVGATGIYGMFISGTRGAIIVPLLGAMFYIVHRKNIRVIITGAIVLLAVYVFFKYTYIGQGINQIRRMRTAFNPEEDASLQVRLQNRATLKTFLSDKPFGGGIGGAGDWGKRFSPGSFLANIATDSWFVQIWAEQGIVGLLLHLFVLSYIAVKGSFLIMFRVKDPELRGKLSALLAAYAGIVGSSYGNGVLGQLPTGILTYFSWGFIFLAPMLDDEIQEAKLQIEE